MTREYTLKLYDLLDNECISKDAVIDACLAYMSEDDVKDMMHVNDMIDYEEEKEEEES